MWVADLPKVCRPLPVWGPCRDTVVESQRKQTKGDKARLQLALAVHAYMPDRSLVTDVGRCIMKVKTTKHKHGA